MDAIAFGLELGDGVTPNGHFRTLAHAEALLLERLVRRDVQGELDRLFPGQDLPPADSGLVAVVA